MVRLTFLSFSKPGGYKSHRLDPKTRPKVTQKVTDHASD